VSAGGKTRTLRSYLLLPRPKDAVKWWILPTTFAMGVLSNGGATTQQVWRFVVVWAALELLVYQARYQWNDIRGFVADQQHPDCHARGRLPGPLDRARRHVSASWLVALTRLSAVAAVPLLLPALHVGGALAALTGAVFAIAIVYETLRAIGTGRTDRVPPPVRPAILGLWIVVGAGYAVRGVAGLALAIDVTARPLLAAASIVTLWAFGVAFVTGRWTLEALAFAEVDGPRVVWRARVEQAREHSLALTRWLPAHVPVDGSPNGGRWRAADWPALRGRTAALAPWNIAAVVTGTCAAATGRLLAAPAGGAGTLIAAGCGGLVTMAVLAAPRHRGPAVLLGAAVIAGVLAAVGSPCPLLATLPWIGVLGAHIFFTSQSLSTFGHPLRDALTRLGGSRGARQLPRAGTRPGGRAAQRTGPGQTTPARWPYARGPCVTTQSGPETRDR